MSLHYSLESIGGISVLRFEDSKVVPEAGDALYELVEQGGHRRLLLDFEKVAFLSSNALAILVTLKKRVKAVGGTLDLCGLAPDLLDLFRLTRLDQVFDIHPNREAALRAL